MTARTCVHLAQGPRCRLAKAAPEDLPKACESCPAYLGRSRGLGDAIAKATKAIGVKPCGGCQKRREALNRYFPFG